MKQLYALYALPYFLCSNVMIAAKHITDVEYTKDTTYIALTGELWGVCCEEFGKNDRIKTAPYRILHLCFLAAIWFSEIPCAILAVTTPTSLSNVSTAYSGTAANVDTPIHEPRPWSCMFFCCCCIIHRESV